jgi:hypothetical protein
MKDEIATPFGLAMTTCDPLIAPPKPYSIRAAVICLKQRSWRKEFMLILRVGE